LYKKFDRDAIAFLKYGLTSMRLEINEQVYTKKQATVPSLKVSIVARLVMGLGVVSELE
jgi:hypothetical protein